MFADSSSPASISRRGDPKSSGKPPVHLWVYNHPFTGIGDQVEFFVTALKQHGYPVTVGRQPSQASLNVVIENFTAHTGEILANFCKTSRKRVAVIMTEHLDFSDGQLLIHGQPLWSDNDYMPPATQLARLRYLFDFLPYYRCFFVLGDLPELRNMDAMLPGLAVRPIPFPGLSVISDREQGALPEISQDLLFTGAITAYRSNVLAWLKSNGLSVDYPEWLVSRNRRDALNQSAKILLNIPQREGWAWLSLMRVVAGLRAGRATVSLGTDDKSKISSCCVQLDIRQPDWLDRLSDCIVNWKGVYEDAHKAYATMACDFEHAHAFPHDLFEYWAITDRLSY